MSAGDSFLRVTRPDGAPEGGDDDGIGLPNRRPSGGGRRPPKKGGIKAPAWLWVAVVGTAAVGTLLVVARKEIAAEIAEGWLKGQGVPASVKLSKLSLSRVSGTIVIGDEKHPDVSIERFDAAYSLHPFAGGGQPLFRLKSLHAVHPLVAVVVKDGKLHFGSIHKLVQTALSAPSTGAPPPDSIILDDATVLLQTDYGALRTNGDVKMRAGQLTDLSLSVPKSQFEGTKGSGEITGGYLTAKAVAGGRLEVHARLDAPRWDLRDVAASEGADGQDFRARNVAFALDGYIPYRKATGLAALAGKLDAKVAVSAGSIEGAFGTTKDLNATLRLDGQTKATAKYIEYEGAAALQSRAGGLKTADVDTQGLRLEGPALGLRARYDVKDGLTLAAGGALTGEAGTLRQGGLSVRSARLNLTNLAATLTSAETKADFKGNLSLGQASISDITLSGARAPVSGTLNAIPGEWSVKLDADLTSGASYSGLKPLADSRREDPQKENKTPEGDDIVALDRAFQRFTLRARGLKVALMGQAAMPPRYDIRLSGATADLDGGGRAVLTPGRNTPVLSTEALGGFGVTVGGADLPGLALTVSKFGYANPSDSLRLSGAYRLNGELTTVPVEGASFDARGGFAIADNGFTATLDAPVAVSVRSAELGTHVENIVATIAQREGALVRVTPSGWRVSGTYSGLALTAPTEALKLSGGQGDFDAYSQGSSDVLGLKLSLTSGTGADAMADDKRRFNPMRLTGTLEQDTRRMTGRFVAATPAVPAPGGGPLPVVAIGLDNDPLSGKGRLSFDTIDLKFAPGALQPHHLSPLATTIMTRDVSGSASFTGRFDWAPAGGSSGGVLATDGINFTGPAGIAEGMKARIVFTSLAPLETEPNQKVTVSRIQSAVPFENLDLGVQFKGDHVAVEGATVQSPGGPVRLEAMRLPLDGETPITGVVAFNGLDFGKVIAATDLRQHMTFEGRLTGRVPFTLMGEHMTFKDGGMAADGPGRISILRSGVADVAATGSVSSDAMAEAGQTPAEFNPFQDLAFQAMEFLSYEQLDARINSLPDGRVNVNFHIKGHFDPPQRQKATVSISDYLSGKWMQKPIKLPSNTPVELNLDIPVNFNDILAGFKPRGDAKPEQ